ncbi:type III-B CRISPR module RAMP protein Cmr6 [Paenibacillus sp. NRS-1781]|uniref:type III-B CRISPR module RAMP protein Cmr6 n=1 Tax=unclassified Paenibacillus TaxID=185978 RepID=UPI003D28B4A8
MNTYLAMTKSNKHWHGEKINLEQVLKEKGNKDNTKAAFYERICEYQKNWTTAKMDWYKHYFNQYYKPEHFVAATRLSFIVESQTPIVIGDGHSVLETSLALHRIYGVPYLPATALKGVASHYVHRQLGDQYPTLKRTGDDFGILFGTPTSAGFVQFHDALPTPKSVEHALRQDVLTPHHQDYNGIIVEPYHKGLDYKAPRDDDSPIPVPFLTASACFQIVLTCEGEPEQATKWLSLAKTILLGALNTEGIGGKTNAGYGRLLEIEQISDEKAGK